MGSCWAVRSSSEIPLSKNRVLSLASSEASGEILLQFRPSHLHCTSPSPSPWQNRYSTSVAPNPARHHFLERLNLEWYRLRTDLSVAGTRVITSGPDSVRTNVSPARAPVIEGFQAKPDRHVSPAGLLARLLPGGDHIRTVRLPTVGNYPH